MPTYEYRCSDCGFEFEEFQSMVSEPLKVCPHCNKETVVRKISGGSGLIFKGNGFYITDYKNSNSAPAASSKKSKKKTENKTKAS